MTIYSFETLYVRFELSQEEEIRNISAPELQFGHLDLSNFKTLKKESVLSFFICGPGAEIWPLSHFSCISL